MSVVPDGLETDTQPPMTIPLRHFLVGLGFLLAGGIVGIASEVGTLPGTASLAHVHLLLVGWVCVTIMGAMTQFVPVWSSVALHSRRLAALQLPLVGVGLAGFALGLLTGWVAVLPWFGALVLGGFWVFVYNLARTLQRVDSLDVTERHFAVALGFFLLLTALGLLLAVDFVWPIFEGAPVDRSGAVGAHATLAVFGAVLTTVFGALYQLATMFTQSDLHGIDHPLQRFEEVAYPSGVLVLAVGRLFELRILGVVGGLAICGAVLAVGVVLARRLYEARVEWTPMLSRYAVVAPAMAAWALLTVPAWIDDPLTPATRFGAPETGHLLGIGVIGFVVLGTLYHVVPFIVWVHRYSDRLGLETVPMIDDLYSDRIAVADFWAFAGGGGLLLAADTFDLPRWVGPLAGLLLLVGAILFLWNMAGVLRGHSPHSLGEILGLRTGAETG